MIIPLLTYWNEKELVCCCPKANRCRKERGCEELDFTLNPYSGLNECMKHNSYTRHKGAIQQRR